MHSPHHSSFDGPIAMTSVASLRDEASRDRPYAASAHPMDQGHRARISGFNTKERFSSPQQENGVSPMTHGSRRSMNMSPQSKYNSSPLHEQRGPVREDEAPLQVRGEGTESTVSTTAPSTVWDELDDLKSRIRKIELTGTLPSTSNAAISTVYGERPLTATTTVTTTSSSPKRRQRASASPEASTVQENSAVELHPLLRSALAKAKTQTNTVIYRALEATASDALTLAAITGSRGSQGASNPPNSNIMDRQLRRRADGMCRSLTELCIALAEDKVESEGPARVRPGSREAAGSSAQRSEDPRFTRAVSEDPELRASSRVMSRLEARRTSLLGAGSVGLPSPKDSLPAELQTPTQERSPVLSKLERTSSVIRRRDEEDETSVGRRPLSRAATELGSHRPSPQTRSSREYTSQHPMPSLQHRSPSIQPSVPARKTYFSSSSTQSPVTPNVLPGNRRYLDRSTLLSAGSARLAEARQRRITSLGESSSASNTQRNIRGPNGRLRQVEIEP